MKTILIRQAASLCSGKTAILGSLLVWAALLTGCPASKPASDGAGEAGGDKVVIRGSNTIGEELAPRLIVEFKKEHAKVTFDLEAKATGYGMAALRAGKCDIAAASRAAIKADLDLAQQAGVEMADYIIGAYSVAVIVHGGNSLTALTKQQVHDIFTGGIKNWQELGGPDAPIHLYIRDPISGTHLGFKELAMDNAEYPESAKLLTSYEAIAQAVAGDPHGIGYASLNPGVAGVKTLTIDGVAPTPEAVHAGKYPYSRILRFYTNKNRESRPTRDFVNFVLSPHGQEILAKAGFTTKPGS